MARASGGTRRDSRIANQRRLGLVRRLLRGPATADTLIADLRAMLSDDIYPADAPAALRHDMTALCETFGCAFFFRNGEGYFLTRLGMLTLFDPTADNLEALQVLFLAIDAGAVPQTAGMARIKERLRALIPEEARAQLAQPSPLVRLDLPTPTTGAVAALVARVRPLLGVTEITFQYRSPYTAPDAVEQHHIAPYALFQRDGATYLDGHCIDSDIQKLCGRYIPYRLDRIVPKSVRRLPRQLAPVRPARRSYRLRYALAPAVAARQDITLWFADSTCTYADDGSAVVEACITDLWQARQILLRYREQCRVLEPPELVEMLRESVARMQQVYDVDEEVDESI